MSDDKNSRALEESDSLDDVAELTERLRLAIKELHRLDAHWPHGANEMICSGCGGVLPNHLNQQCRVKLILGA
jgi:hypothetical protein